MLRDGAGVKRVIVVTDFTDLQQGIDSLAFIIQDQFRLVPLDKGTMFLFCGRWSDRIKGLFFEGDVYLLFYKRLAPGYRFHWPRNEQETRELTYEQFEYLMKGFSPLQKGLPEEVTVASPLVGRTR